MGFKQTNPSFLQHAIQTKAILLSSGACDTNKSNPSTTACEFKQKQSFFFSSDSTKANGLFLQYAIQTKAILLSSTACNSNKASRLFLQHANLNKSNPPFFYSMRI
jgi:hypothetical protein